MGREFTLNRGYELFEGSTHYSATTVDTLQYNQRVQYIWRHSSRVSLIQPRNSAKQEHS